MLWFLGRHDNRVDINWLLYMVFLADREHLVSYGRPIIGGKYTIDRFAPSLAELRTDLGHSDSNRLFGCSNHPHVVESLLECDEDFFSASDIEVLTRIDDQYKDKDYEKLFEEIKDLVACKSVSGGTGPLPYESLFLDYPDNERNSDMLGIIREDNEARLLLY